jgi:GMP synthase-like glutamine amidotransferase
LFENRFYKIFFLMNKEISSQAGKILPNRRFGEPGQYTFPPHIERRIPGEGQLLFFSAEPHGNMVRKFGHTVPFPDQEVYAQWNVRTHRMNPVDLLTVPVHNTAAQMPDIKKDTVAGIIGSGAGAMVTDGGEALRKFQKTLTTLPDLEITTFLTCFTMQAYMDAIGGRVKENESKTRKFGVGRYTLTDAGKKHWLFEGVGDIDDSFLAFRSHSQDLDPDSLPPGYNVLAVDSEDGSVAAIGYGDWFAGIQFHNELDMEAMIALTTPDRIRELNDQGINYEQFLLGLDGENDEVMQIQERINENFYRQMRNRYELAS